MNQPLCQTCKTDEHLDYYDYHKGHNEIIEIPVFGGGIIRKPNRIKPTVRFKCNKCGFKNGITVEEDWILPQ